MTLLQGPTNQTKHDVISPEILKAGVHLHLLEWHDALVVQQNRKAPWKKGGLRNVRLRKEKLLNRQPLFWCKT